MPYNFWNVHVISILLSLLLVAGCHQGKKPFESQQVTSIKQPTDSAGDVNQGENILNNPDSLVEAIRQSRSEIETNLASNQVLFQAEPMDTVNFLVFKDGDEIVKISRFSPGQQWNYYFHERIPILVVHVLTGKLSLREGMVEEWLYLCGSNLVRKEIDKNDEDLYRVSNLSERKTIYLGKEEKQVRGPQLAGEARSLLHQFEHLKEYSQQISFLVNEDPYGEYKVENTVDYPYQWNLEMVSLPGAFDWEDFIHGNLERLPCYLVFSGNNTGGSETAIYPNELSLNDKNFSFYARDEVIGSISFWGKIEFDDEGNKMIGHLRVNQQEVEELELKMML